MVGALDGIRILDFTRYQQGPVGTRMLAELGAEVWKVEPRGTGDLSRQTDASPDGYSPTFYGYSRGKKSLTIDVRKPEGRELALRLGEHADVVTDNFRPGVMQRLGLGYADFKERKPDIIVASASALGAAGPLASRPGYDVIGQAMGGVMILQSHGPDDEPRTLPGGFADQIGGMQLCVAVLGALVALGRTGTGQQVATSLLGSQMTLQIRYLMEYLHSGGQHYERRRRTPIFTFYQARDALWFVIGVIDQQNWDKLCLVMEAEELLSDPRFSDPQVMLEHNEELEAELDRRFRQRDRDEWLQIFAEADIPHAPVNSNADLVAMEQPWANGYLEKIDHPQLGSIDVVGVPWQFTETPAIVPVSAPELGEHTDEILGRIGLPDDEIARLRAEEII